jgi:hypothetical protein
MKCQSYSFFRGSDYFTYRSDLPLFQPFCLKTKRHLYDNMDDRHSAWTDTQERFTSKGSQGRMDSSGSTEPPMFANEVSEGEINDQGSWGSYPEDPVVRVATQMMQPCSSGQTPGLATPLSTQTWLGSSLG